MELLVEKTVEIEAFGAFPAVTVEGQYWNGFECPMFTKETADKVMEAVNNYGDGLSMKYDAEKDAYIYLEEGYEEESYTAIVKGNTKYYPIGAYGWSWS